MPELIREERYP